MVACLTTHILDTSIGRPATGVKVELFRLIGDARELLVAMHTNADGRTDSPLMSEEEFLLGVYELVFHLGEYFDDENANAGVPSFLDIVPLRFGISEKSHYHVPLLLSPFGYSTYRGS